MPVFSSFEVWKVLKFHAREYDSCTFSAARLESVATACYNGLYFSHNWELLDYSELGIPKSVRR